MYEEIKRRVDALRGKMSHTRRDLHENAESGWFEMRTTAKIVEALESFGCYEVLTGRDVCLAESRMGLPTEKELDDHYEWALSHGAEEKYLAPTKGGFTGAVAILKNGAGPTVAFRFDIDALGVYEKTSQDHLPAREGFASICPGSMHACGHDGHATIGLAVAEVLASMRDRLHGTIKLIFQPAEEGVRGAKSIVDRGHLDGVDVVIGSHIYPSDGHEYSVTAGCDSSFATSKLDVYLTGQSAHAAGAPERGRNVMMAAANIVMNTYALARNSKGANRVNVGTVQAGSGRNVIPDRAKLEMEVRGETTELNDWAHDQIMRVIEHSAKMYGCESRVVSMGEAPSMENTPELVEQVRAVISDELGMKVLPGVGDVAGSEDFTYMCKRVIDGGGKAAFVLVNVPLAGPQHSPEFDFDEEALAMGAKMFCSMAYKLMGR